MGTKKRGQISVEYLIVLGFATFAITGIIALAFYYINSTSDTMTSNHIKNFADSIISSSESVYFAGPPSKMTIQPYLPKGVKAIETIDDPVGSNKYYLVITYQTSSGENKIGFPSKVPLILTTAIPGPERITTSEGIKNVVIGFDASNTKIKITGS
jgi:uncharacterized protein (UPF0333 family)